MEERRILIVEDEAALARYMQLELQHEGYVCDVLHSGLQAVEMIAEHTYQCVLLDMMLPHLDGLEVCRRIRQASDVPVLIVTAREAVSDKISGLDMGADDYLVKPFNIEELLARIRALRRRHERHQPSRQKLRSGELTLDATAREVRYGDEPVTLTKREFDLLEYMLENQGQVRTRHQILEAVWGYDFEVDTNIVDVYVRYVRNKLKACGAGPVIETVRGVGYTVRSGKRP